jgi:uncharacterized protein
MDEVDIPLSSQKTLLHLARQTLEDFVRKTLRPKTRIDDPYLSIEDFGVFVSLHRRDELRGCIGTLTGQGPLYETVVEMTQAAASRDSRVEPIRRGELDKIRISISVLSPLKVTDDPLSLTVGKHGLSIAQGARHGVLLPQVATEYQWNIVTFLEQTCLKAGLCKNAWQEDGTEVSSFTALIIEERSWNGAGSSDC